MKAALDSRISGSFTAGARPPTCLSASGIVKRFKETLALDALDLDVPKGRVFGVLGPNGAGKTTAMHVFLGLLKPDLGHARVFDLDPWRQGDALRRKVGALLEHNGLYERLTAQENLEFIGRVHGWGPAERHARANELLEQGGFWERRKDKVRTYSKGMKQRLAILRALYHRPELLFLDEPTASFDPQAAAEIRSHIAELVKREGLTVYLNTHNLAEAEQLCDRIAVLRRGRVVRVGSPHEIRRGASLPRVLIRGSGFTPAVVEKVRRLKIVSLLEARDGTLTVHLTTPTPAGPVVRALVGAGAEVDEVQVDTATLEEAVLKLLGNGGGA